MTPRTTRPRSRGDREPVPASAHRESWHFLAHYYAWSARHGGLPTPPGNDPRTGRPWNPWDPTTARLARAAYIALAREAYAIARAHGPTPLP